MNLDANASTIDPPAIAAVTIFGSGRLGPTAAAVLGLVGTLVGARTLRRLQRGGSSDGRAHVDRWGAATALALGATSVVGGTLFLLTADGGPGTGNGVVGSAAALLLGPVAIALGALARSRRPSSPRAARARPTSGTG